jgi:predicted transcriptional regulator
VMQKTKVTLVLDDDAATRLAVCAAMTKQERSHVVGQLIREHLRRFRVQDLDQPDRARPDDTGIGGNPSGD